MNSQQKKPGQLASWWRTRGGLTCDPVKGCFLLVYAGSGRNQRLTTNFAGLQGALCLCASCVFPTEEDVLEDVVLFLEDSQHPPGACFCLLFGSGRHAREQPEDSDGNNQ